jgi:hypothetical protein
MTFSVVVIYSPGRFIKGSVRVVDDLRDSSIISNYDGNKSKTWSVTRTREETQPSYHKEGRVILLPTVLFAHWSMRDVFRGTFDGQRVTG